MSLKIPVTPPGIDPGTVRLVAQCLNYYATPGLDVLLYVSLFVIKMHLSVTAKFVCSSRNILWMLDMASL